MVFCYMIASKLIQHTKLISWPVNGPWRAVWEKWIWSYCPLQHPLSILNTCSDRELTTSQGGAFYLWLSLAQLKYNSCNFALQLNCRPLESYREVKFLLNVTVFQPNTCILGLLYLSQLSPINSLFSFKLFSLSPLNRYSLFADMSCKVGLSALPL